MFQVSRPSPRPTGSAALARAGRRLAGLAGLLLVFAAAGCKPDYPSCEEDGDCKEGEFCVNQLCQQCREDTDCADGQQCNGGACEDIPGFCNSASDCGDGQTCVAQRCQAAPPAPAPEPEPEPQVTEAPCEIRTVYFDYDSSTLEQEARDTIAENARCMKERGLTSMRLVGHTDNRGTEEYNLALGDRRARAVQQYMVSLGIDAASLRTASMGEEMSHGTDEASWAKDRKVEFESR